jgi:hypothetical protein
MRTLNLIYVFFYILIFKYLGSVVQENGSSDLKIVKSISETGRDISMLHSVLWNRNILHSTKLIICK